MVLLVFISRITYVPLNINLALLAGMLQILGGLMGLGKFIRLVPHPVMLGFVNGLAIVMTKAQLGNFRGASGAFLSLKSLEGQATYGITALTMVLIRFVFPKIKNKTVKKVPPTLGAVALVSVVTRMLQLPIRTLADVAGKETFRGGMAVLPKFGLPSGIPFLSQPLETFSIIFPYAATMAAVGCIESLLTMQLIDGELIFH